jgi:SagB-type dehydrogenase family enzyme
MLKEIRPMTDPTPHRDPIEAILAYHEATKHRPDAYARGPGHLDWASQPDPFRRYGGARLHRLPILPPGRDPGPPYDAAFTAGMVEPPPLDLSTISRLFHDSLALSAWKSAGGERWALRVNPSSGNLHPTEGYLVCGPVEGLTDVPILAHYAPREHALEIRAEFAPVTWRRLTADLPDGTVLVGLTSVHWREAWKYGERAYRYCQHDAGHAIAAIAVAAGALGRRTRLLEDVSTEEIAALLGVRDPADAEPETPDCLIAIFPGREPSDHRDIPSGWAGEGAPADPTTPGIAPDAFRALGAIDLRGAPNRLSPDHVDWSIIERASGAAEKPRTPLGEAETAAGRRSAVRRPLPGAGVARNAPIRPILHGRRSAVAMDGRTEIERDAFYRILRATLPVPGRVPFDAFPGPARVDLLLFVHPRVRGMPPGLYCLVREPGRMDRLRAAFREEFSWDRPEDCPEDLPLHRLAAGDVQAVAGELSCFQAIAADGCFALGMIADFEAPIRRHGAWIYPRLFRECGAIGQVLYLEAEAAGLRGTGIGCFFDDPVHRLLGIGDLSFQSLYHFTIGGPVEDDRIMTLPAYPEADVTAD